MDRQQGNLQKIAVKAQDVLKVIDIEKQVYEGLFDKHGLKVISTESAISTSELELKIETDLLAAVASTLPQDADILILSLREDPFIYQSMHFHEEWMKTAAKSSSSSISALHSLLSCESSEIVPQKIAPSVPSTNTEENVNEDSIDWGDFDISIEPDLSAVNVVEESSLPSESSGRLIQDAIDAINILVVFFRQRTNELSQKDDFLDLVMGRTISTMSEDLRRYDNAASIADFAMALEKAKQKLIFFLKKVSLLESRMSTKEVVSAIVQKRSKIIQLERSMTVIQSKREETEKNLQICLSKIECVKTFIVDLRTHLETSLSKLCGGRVVTISIPN